MLFGHKSRSNGDIACQSRFRGKQVVPRSREFSVFCAVSDMKQSPVGVVQKAEVHVFDEMIKHIYDIISVRKVLLCKPQRRQKITAVHGRYILRTKRPQTFNVVPVKKLSFPFFKFPERGKQIFHALRRIVMGYKPKRFGTHSRHNIHGDICWGGICNGWLFRFLLKVVGRQEVILLRTEFFVKPPCCSGDLFKLLLFAFVRLLLLRPHISVVHKQRCKAPEYSEYCAYKRSIQQKAGKQHQCAERHAHCRLFVVLYYTLRLDALGLRSGLPFKHLLMRNPRPPYRPYDSI